MKHILPYLFEYKKLSKELAKETLIKISKGEVNQSQIAAFLTAFQMRSISVDELAGFKEALLELCLNIDLSEFETIDLCGTGGDGKNTFNISTLSAFVVAGAGVKVSKHGNYGVSSNCGSSNVMEHLGYTFTNNESTLKHQLDKAGICFLHAPLFHPAMKQVAPIRKELGIKTFFNMLGPMVNPAHPQNQLVGVFSLELARLYHYLYQKTNKKYIILHALDGYDEISLTGDFKVMSQHGESILSPKDIGLETLNATTIEGGETIKGAADLFVNILEQKGTSAQNQAIFANAGMAIHCATGKSIPESINMAKESLESGRAYEAFKNLIALNKA